MRFSSFFSFYRAAFALTALLSSALAMEEIAPPQITKKTSSQQHITIYKSLSPQELLLKTEKGDQFSKGILLDKIIDGLVPDQILKTMNIELLCDFPNLNYWKETADQIIAAYFVLAKVQQLSIQSVLFPFVQKQAALGSSLAQVNLAKMYQKEYGVPTKNQENNKIAFDLYTKAAKAGNPRAQFALGNLHRKGRVIPLKSQKENDKIAFDLYTKAAKAGNPRAQFALGIMCELNRGFSSKNLKEADKNAIKWYTLAGDQGHFIAQNNLGIMYKEDRGCSSKKPAANDKKAVEWLTKSAESGFVLAQFNLAMMYREGRVASSIDDSQNNKMAEIWLLKAAQQGHPIAQNNLGVLYKQNSYDKEAIKWFKKAAEQDNPISQFNLCLMYKEGRGCSSIKSEKSIHWLINSALQNFPPAKEELPTYFIPQPFTPTEALPMQAKENLQELKGHLEKLGHHYTSLGNSNQIFGLYSLATAAGEVAQLLQEYTNLTQAIEDPTFMITCLKLTETYKLTNPSIEYSFPNMGNRYICLRTFSSKILWNDSLKTHITKAQVEVDQICASIDLLIKTPFSKKAKLINTLMTDTDSKNKDYYSYLTGKIATTLYPETLIAYLQKERSYFNQVSLDIHDYDAFTAQLNRRFHLLIHQTAAYRNTLFIDKIWN